MIGESSLKLMDVIEIEGVVDGLKNIETDENVRSPVERLSEKSINRFCEASRKEYRLRLSSRSNKCEAARRDDITRDSKTLSQRLQQLSRFSTQDR